MRGASASLLVLSGLIAGAASAPPAAAAEPRLVTLGAAVTEIVRDLGAADQVIGYDSTSVTVDLGREVEDVGFFRRVSAPGVLSLKPTRVIALDDAGPEGVFSALAQAGVEVTRVPNAVTVEQAVARIETIASVLGRTEAGAKMVQTLKADLQKVQRPATKPRVLFVYARGGGAALVAGRNTSASALTELAGGTPAVTAFEGFKPLSPEAAITAAPDVLLLTDAGLATLGGREGLSGHPVLGQTPAVKAGRVVVMDDLRLLGFGPELGKVVQELAREFGAAAREEG